MGSEGSKLGARGASWALFPLLPLAPPHAPLFPLLPFCPLSIPGLLGPHWGLRKPWEPSEAFHSCRSSVRLRGLVPLAPSHPALLPLAPPRPLSIPGPLGYSHRLRMRKVCLLGHFPMQLVNAKCLLFFSFGNIEDITLNWSLNVTELCNADMYLSSLVIIMLV